MIKKFFIVLSILGWLFFCSISYAGKISFQSFFLGVEGSLLDNIKKRFEAKMQTEVIRADARELLSFFNEAPQEIKKALEPFGYFNVRVSSKLVQDGDNWRAIFTIALSKPIKISSIDFKILGSGKKDPLFSKFVEENFPRSGQILLTEKYRNFKQNLYDLAFRNGYFSITIIKDEILVYPEENRAEINFHFQTGPHYRFGSVSFSKTPFSPLFLKRFLPFREGDFYRAEDIELLQENLANSNFFTDVTVMPEVEKSVDNLVPLEIDLIARKARQYDFGLGFGTDTGIRGRLGLELRHLTSFGHQARAFIKASEVQSDFEMYYLIPGRNPVTDQYDISVAAETQDQSYGTSRAVKVSFGYATRVFDVWRGSIRLNVQQERYNIENQPWQNAFFLLPSVNLLYVRADDPIRVMRGYRVNFNFQGAKKELLSNADFVQVGVDGKYICQVSPANIVVLRGLLGFTAISDLFDLPLSMQYFTGGAQSVRGYSYNSLGPGRNLVALSAELRRKITSDWYLTIFYDAGNASSSFKMPLKKGVGFGVAWFSPVGTISLSYTKALNAPGEPGMIQFSMGPEL